MHDSKTFNNVFYALKEDLIYATEFKIQEMAREGSVPSTFEIRQSSRSVPEQHRVEETPAPRLLVHTTISRVVIRFFTSFTIILVVPTPVASLIDSSPIASPATIEAESFLAELGAQVELSGGLIHDHTQRLDALPTALFEGYDRDLRELYTRSRAVSDEIFSQRYRLRSLKQEQERATMTFGTIWRPLLALESWEGNVDAQRATMW
ncbi:hypothetical protein Tco_0123073 [Tanacetum coccineum]